MPRKQVKSTVASLSSSGRMGGIPSTTRHTEKQEKEGKRREKTDDTVGLALPPSEGQFKHSVHPHGQRPQPLGKVANALACETVVTLRRLSLSIVGTLVEA